MQIFSIFDSTLRKVFSVRKAFPKFCWNHWKHLRNRFPIKVSSPKLFPFIFVKLIYLFKCISFFFLHFIKPLFSTLDRCPRYLQYSQWYWIRHVFFYYWISHNFSIFLLAAFIQYSYITLRTTLPRSITRKRLHEIIPPTPSWGRVMLRPTKFHCYFHLNLILHSVHLRYSFIRFKWILSNMKKRNSNTNNMKKYATHPKRSVMSMLQTLRVSVWASIARKETVCTQWSHWIQVTFIWTKHIELMTFNFLKYKFFESFSTRQHIREYCKIQQREHLQNVTSQKNNNILSLRLMICTAILSHVLSSNLFACILSLIHCWRLGFWIQHTVLIREIIQVYTLFSTTCIQLIRNIMKMLKFSQHFIELLQLLIRISQKQNMQNTDTVYSLRR